MSNPKTPTAPDPSQTEFAHLVNLIQVLLPHPAGLRRWSVMRAVRSLHEKAAREIPFKLEDELERVFRKHGGDYSDQGEGLFCRPKDRAGEVWAVDAERARALLGSVDRGGTKMAADTDAMASVAR